MNAISTNFIRFALLKQKYINIRKVTYKTALQAVGLYFPNRDFKMEQNKELNRLKVVLVEKKRTAKWLAQELGKDAATISKWNSNTSQPSLETLRKIADLLEVDVRELLIPSKLK